MRRLKNLDIRDHTEPRGVVHGNHTEPRNAVRVSHTEPRGVVREIPIQVLGSTYRSLSPSPTSAPIRSLPVLPQITKNFPRSKSPTNMTTPNTTISTNDEYFYKPGSFNASIQSGNTQSTSYTPIPLPRTGKSPITPIPITHITSGTTQDNTPPFPLPSNIRPLVPRGGHITQTSPTMDPHIGVVDGLGPVVTNPPVSTHVVTINTKTGGCRTEDGILQQSTVMGKVAQSHISGPEGRVLKRGISKTADNLVLVSSERDRVLSDVREDNEEQVQYLDTPPLMFVLPDLSTYEETFRAFLEKDLIETYTLNSLTQAGVLNWWQEWGIARKLWPMATTGDGNCLLHAASLAMWSFHDRDLILRNALHHSMTAGAFHGALLRRWRFQQMHVNKQSGLIYSEVEWQQEWDNLLRLASTQPRHCDPNKPSLNHPTNCCDIANTTKNCPMSPQPPSGVIYESLEEFHVFVLAHVLRRPIIVVADKFLRDTTGEALAPIPFGGVYLPLECKPECCHRTPLLLTYDAAHFSALVLSEMDNLNLQPGIPLIYSDYTLLPLHFHIDPGEHFDWSRLEKNNEPEIDVTLGEKMSLLHTYLDIEQSSVTRSDNIPPRKSSSSDDSVGSNNGKERKKDSKMQQQVNTVAKQFGSIGKSMGKKLKNLGSKTTCIKAMPEDALHKGVTRPGINAGSVITGFLRVPSMVVIDEDHIPCACLNTHRSDIQDQMVKNYLTEALDRFNIDRDLKRKKAEELLARGIRPPSPAVPMKCVSEGCSMYGVPDTSYLCSDCYTRSKRQLQEKDDFVKREGKSKFYVNDKSSTLPRMNKGETLSLPAVASQPIRSSNTLPRSLKADSSNNSLNRSPVLDDAVNTKAVNQSSSSDHVPVGKLISLDDASRSPVYSESAVCSLPLVNTQASVYSQTSTARTPPAVHSPRTPPALYPPHTPPVLHSPPTLHTPPTVHPPPTIRCASPQYDNLEYERTEKVGGISAVHKADAVACRSVGCTFYGSLDNEYYCSKCYKEKGLGNKGNLVTL